MSAFEATLEIFSSVNKSTQFLNLAVEVHRCLIPKKRISNIQRDTCFSHLEKSKEGKDRCINTLENFVSVCQDKQ